ncbi:hypothetical protein ES703_63290 [subsurface metagenome]
MFYKYLPGAEDNRYAVGILAGVLGNCGTFKSFGF